MFWQSVIQGLISLANWEILVGMLCVGLIQVVFMWLIGLFIMKGESGARAAMGCLVGAAVGPVIQALAVTAFIILLLPSLHLGRGFTPLEVVTALGPTSIRYGLLSLALVSVLSFIPIVGGFVSKTPGLATFLQGILVFKPISKILLYSLLDENKVTEDFYPGFWACVGYFFIGFILINIAFVVVSLIADKLKEKRDPVAHMLDGYRDRWSARSGKPDEPTTFQFIAAQFLGPMLGIIPLLMYGKYIALSARAAVSG